MNEVRKIQVQLLAGMLANPALVRWMGSESDKTTRLTLDLWEQREALSFKAFQIAEQIVHGPKSPKGKPDAPANPLVASI